MSEENELPNPSGTAPIPRIVMGGRPASLPDIDLNDGPDSVAEVTEAQNAEVTEEVAGTLAEVQEDEDPAGMPQGEANVRLSKTREHEALPVGLVNIGMHEGILIPTTKTQLAGFYVKDPAVLIGQFPQYKWVQEKGSDRPTE